MLTMVSRGQTVCFARLSILFYSRQKKNFGDFYNASKGIGDIKALDFDEFLTIFEN